jgi:hypothetical protein
MAENDIVIKFKKEDGNIFLESINDSGEDKTYDSNLPLLTINDEGKYTAIEGALDKVIINEKAEEEEEKEGQQGEPVTEAENFDFSDNIYPSKNDKEDEEKQENPLLAKENENKQQDTNELQEQPVTTEGQEQLVTNELPEQPATNELPEQPVTTEGQEQPATNECQDKFNVYNNEIASADCNTLNKNFKKLASKVHPDKNPNCGDASTDTMKKLNNKKQECEKQSNKSSLNTEAQPEALKELQDATTGGKKNRTKKSKKGGNKKTKRVRFIMTRKGRKNRKNKTRR